MKRKILKSLFITSVLVAPVMASAAVTFSAKIPDNQKESLYFSDKIVIDDDNCKVLSSDKQSFIAECDGSGGILFPVISKDTGKEVVQMVVQNSWYKPASIILRNISNFKTESSCDVKGSCESQPSSKYYLLSESAGQLSKTPTIVLKEAAK